MSAGDRVPHTRQRATAIGVVMMGLVAVPLLAHPCGETTPAVNKVGFRPATTVFYDVGASPDGTPFPEGMRRCVDRAFDAWTTANTWAGSWVRFASGPGGIVVRFDQAGGLVLHRKRAGAWTDAIRSPEGYLERANVWISRDQALVSRCRGVTKVVLHELGHLHGLADIRTERGRTVMNPLGGTDDRHERLPMAPTRCDATHAAIASFIVPRDRAAIVSARR